MSYLLDTSVLFEYVRKKPVPQVIDWLDSQDERSLFISSLTLAELRKGFYKLRTKAVEKDEVQRAAKLGLWLQCVESRFENRILAIDERVLELWAMMCGQSEANGKKLPVVDSLLVATALVHAMFAVTRNSTDFRNCSEAVNIFNPFESR